MSFERQVLRIVILIIIGFVVLSVARGMMYPGSAMVFPGR